MNPREPPALGRTRRPARGQRKGRASRARYMPHTRRCCRKGRWRKGSEEVTALRVGDAFEVHLPVSRPTSPRSRARTTRHSEVRDELIGHVHGLAVEPGRLGGSLVTPAILHATEEPAARAYSRLIQLQGPLAGAFLKDIPGKGKTFWNTEWTAFSRFRFGIPLSSAPSLRDGAKWGDEAVEKHGELTFQRHDKVRDALARSLRGIRAFCAHTECRLGTSNLYSDLVAYRPT